MEILVPDLERRAALGWRAAPWQAFASIRDGGQTVAIGRVAVAAGWAGLTAIEVAAAHRRRGLATAPLPAGPSGLGHWAV